MVEHLNLLLTTIKIKNKKMCNQAVDINIDASEYIAQCFKTQEM